MRWNPKWCLWSKMQFAQFLNIYQISEFCFDLVFCLFEVELCQWTLKTSRRSECHHRFYWQDFQAKYFDHKIKSNGRSKTGFSGSFVFDNVQLKTKCMIFIFQFVVKWDLIKCYQSISFYSVSRKKWWTYA